jgi:8-oxo-dGTP pyrophosphatase MutT (NUDIX family)
VTAAVPIVRPAARVLLIDDRDRLLLLRARVAWITPGGGVEPGESHEDAALRELREETGVAGVALGPCIWHRRHVTTGLDGVTPYDLRERFYVVRVPQTTISTDGWDEEERAFLSDHRWWSLDEIAASGATFAPRRLAALLAPILRGDLPATPLEIGT